MTDSSRSEIIRILVRLQADGDHRAAIDRVFELTYAELHRLASVLMRQERSDHTLQPTALIHETYVRLVGASGLQWEGRAQFLAIATRAMRQVLVDHARRRSAAKRGGGWERVTLDEVFDPKGARDVDLLRLEDALTQLTEVDERAARVAELRIFGGMKIEEIAHVLGVTSRTVDNDWSVAKIWLTNELTKRSPSS